MAIIRHIVRFSSGFMSAIFSTIFGLFGLAVSASILILPANALGQCCQEVVVSAGQLVLRGGSDTEPPQTPTGLNMQARTGTTITLGWVASTDNVAVTGYRVLRGGALVGTTTTVSYTNTGLQPSTNYSYTVQAYDAANNISPASLPLSVSTTNGIPPAPANLSATGRNGYVDLSWSASAAATGYNVKRSLASGGPFTTIASNVSSTQYTDAGVTNGTTYYYVVSAINTYGESPNSSVVSAQPIAPPAKPTGITATSSGGMVTLSWTASAGAAYYMISKGQISGGPYSELVTSYCTATTFTDPNSMPPGSIYYYVVTAVNAGGQTQSTEVRVVVN